jgi:hypothetical protein
MRTLKVLVDLVDSDEAQGKLETFLSSSPRRKLGDPSTFHPVTLATPLRFGAWPELFERALKSHENSSYQPGPDVQTFQSWENVPRGYQYAPEEPSPDVLETDLSKVKQLGKLGDVELIALPSQDWLVSRRGQTLLDTQEHLGGNELRVTPRAPGLLILAAAVGMQSALGTGACGSCPVLDLILVKMDAQGHFSKPESLEPTFTQGEDISWEASPDLSRIEVFVEYDKAPHKLVLRYTRDPKTGRYIKENFGPPPTDAEE